MTQIIPTRLPFAKYPDQTSVLRELFDVADLSQDDRDSVVQRAADLVRKIRSASKPGLMEVFLAEYGLSTDEGVALMCLAEALLRVPDAETIDALIEDKIAPSDWGKHLGHSSSSLVNASTWALMLTGRVLDESSPGIAGALKGAIKRLGEPVIRTAARQAMREMGQQFVLGQTMPEALERAQKTEAEGYTYSYDMLGEAARTADDAKRYLKAYSAAIDDIGKAAKPGDIRSRPGISVKLSALHPRYEVAQRERVLAELTPRLTQLAVQAAKYNIGLNVDAEEADRLDLSLDVIEGALAESALEGWDGFGVVVQAFGPRAGAVIEHLYAVAGALNRRLMVRLVKGAYWDTEIKHAQVLGMDGFPVFTTKAATDISYIANARRLLGMTDRIYPQFATHNAHSVAAILHMNADPQSYEFQRLHGMGERLHDIVLKAEGTRCRIYAPVGAHRDLLAYLVRRLLENGANSSFVNQIVDEDVAPETVAADPFDAIDTPSRVKTGADMYAPERENSKGWDLTDSGDLARFETARAPFRNEIFSAGPIMSGNADAKSVPETIFSPQKPDEIVGNVASATEQDLEVALSQASLWNATAEDRAEILNRAADLYEDNAGEIFATLAREAGKTPLDAVGELREAVDFLRYYAARALTLNAPAIGRVTCISPWNFPLAIFTGQISGALAAGCAVFAKPAEQTPLIAALGVRLMHKAGVPRDVLQFLPGEGAVVGRALTSDPRIDAVAFTGSTQTALMIRRAMALNLAPGAPLVAETGGLNAMIVDSTALLEQAVRDVVASSFQSAGQRCSALRCLYVQADIIPAFREMLFGAMDELKLGDPWSISTDVGPVIDTEARDGIANYITEHKSGVLKEMPSPVSGHFIAPTVLSVAGISEMKREIFGPVLHLASFESEDLDDVINQINQTGYGLTFGLHTRIDGRVQHIVERIQAGNIYVNRNQIGAVVGSQPFGGEGLSGTGPKAGGPSYIHRFTKPAEAAVPTAQSNDDTVDVQALLNSKGHGLPNAHAIELPGPTGETNRLQEISRAPFLCLGPGKVSAQMQLAAVEAEGGQGIAVTSPLDVSALKSLNKFGGIVWWGSNDSAREIASALADRDGPILPLITGIPRRFELEMERHLCVDTTASGGNAALLAEVADP